MDRIATSLWKRSTAARIIAAFCLCAGMVNSSVDAQCMYEVELIAAPLCNGGGFPLQPPTEPEDMSDNGIVVGHYDQCDEIGRNEAFMWSQQTGFVTLTRPAEFISAQAEGISSDGRYIVGFGRIIGQGTLSLLWENGGDPTIIAPIGDSTSIEALNVNNAGVIVGRMRDPSPKSDHIVPFRMMDGEVEALSSEFSTRGQAIAINEDSVIVGFSGLGGIDAFAAMWNGENGELLARDSKAINARAGAINKSGMIGGSQGVPDDKSTPSQPTLWIEGQPQLLPILPECYVGIVNDISDAGVPVGFCTVPPGFLGRAIIWQNGKVINLNDHIDDARIDIMIQTRSIDQDGRLVVQLSAIVDDVSMVVAGLLTPIGASASDLNKDCTTDTSDLVLLLGEWNQSNSFADVDDNSIVNVFDLLELLADWG